ncbi:hypothetical protein L7F22_048017 [Adiantum nelumboides]|nr:hypothetical protein [Adiantum nelumboides]
MSPRAASSKAGTLGIGGSHSSSPCSQSHSRSITIGLKLTQLYQCLMVASKQGEGLYGLEMTIDDEGMRGHKARHVIGFEDRKDASNFCRLVELRSGSRFRHAEMLPFSPKKLFEVSNEEKFRVTVIRSGQIQLNIDQTLEEVEDTILELGRENFPKESLHSSNKSSYESQCIASRLQGRIVTLLATFNSTCCYVERL